MSHYLGIDVGTGSARAGIFSASGALVGSASQPIRMWEAGARSLRAIERRTSRRPAPGRATRAARRQAGLPAAAIKGIGFDATCSLVVLDGADRPVSVSRTGRPGQNVIAWMYPLRAAVAAAINRTRHPVLRYVGGTISPEMQMPKLLWLKTHLPNTWRRAARFLDLPDFLTYRATGDDTRSLCTTPSANGTTSAKRGGAGRGWDRGRFPGPDRPRRPRRGRRISGASAHGSRPGRAGRTRG